MWIVLASAGLAITGIVYYRARLAWTAREISRMPDVVVEQVILHYHSVGRKEPEKITAQEFTRRQQIVALRMMIAISLIVLTSSLFVVLSGRYDDATRKWAFGSVGLVVGFWLRGPKG